MKICKKTSANWEDSLGVPGIVLVSGFILFIIYFFHSLYVNDH